MGKRESRDRDDPIGDYTEWANNRYNPGYWLGGRVPPHVKNYWTPKDRRWLGVMMLLPYIVALVFVVRRGLDYDLDQIIMAGAFSAPYVAFGLFLLLAPAGKKKPPS